MLVVEEQVAAGAQRGVEAARPAAEVADAPEGAVGEDEVEARALELERQRVER